MASKAIVLNQLDDTGVAGEEGFEPPITGPEPVAVPLGQSPFATGEGFDPPMGLVFPGDSQSTA